MSNCKSQVCFALILPIMLANCAIVPGPKGAGSGDVISGSTITMLSNEPIDGQTDPVALEAVRRVLTGQGYRMAARGDLIADVGFALRERTIGFSSEPRGDRTTGQANSPPQKGDALALCHSQIGRLTISILDYSSKRRVFRGVAEDLFCEKPDESKLFMLASVALRDIRRGVAAR